MLTSLEWLALEVKYLSPAVRFYTHHLDLPIVSESNGEVALAAGASELRLRAPGSVPRGGLHTHFAFSIPAVEYESWWRRLDVHFDLMEHDFGGAKSLYCYDPDGNCVELGQHDTDGTGITGIFEVVLEVEDLDRAEAFYSALGADLIDRGTDRRRVRLDAGPVDIELWEPQLGLADARGGVHVDLGFRADDPQAVADRVRDQACTVTSTEDGISIRDRDHHSLTIRPTE